MIPVKRIPIRDYNHPSVKGIESGQIFIFPEIEGQPVTLWSRPNGELKGAILDQELTSENDPGGFLDWAKAQQSLKVYFNRNYNNVLFGSWKAPDSFVVNDVMTNSEGFYVLSFDEYWGELITYNIDFVSPLNRESASFSEVLNQINQNPDTGFIAKNYRLYNENKIKAWAFLSKEFVSGENFCTLLLGN